MGNTGQKDPNGKQLDDEGKGLIEFFFDKKREKEKRLNIFNCGKSGIDPCLDKLPNYECKQEKKLKKDIFIKSKFGLKYDKKFLNSCWKLYNLSPIIGSKECESLKNMVENKTDKKNKIQNVIVYNCGTDDENDYNIINQFSKMKSTDHPFIIFLSSNRSKEMYEEYIMKNELKSNQFFYDILNIYLIKKGSDEKEIFSILWNIYNYFYQIDKFNNSTFASEICLNIYVIGKPGTGKSSFINELFGEKKALEGAGANVTDKINEYPIIQKLNFYGNKIARINLFDAPGFTTDGSVMKDIKEKIKTIFSNYYTNKDMIHCFLYFLNGSSKRTLDNDEIELITFINTNQKNIFSYSKILFIINFTNKTDDNSKNSYKNILHKQLVKEFGLLSELANKENIIEVNLKRDLEHNRGFKFGIDEIFKKMYNYFIPHKIEVNEILNISKNEENRRLNQNEILNMQIEKLNESMFFKFFKRLEDFKEKNISICEEKIRSSRMETERIGLFIWKSDTAKCVLIRKEMFEFIHDYFKAIFDCDVPFSENDYKINSDEEFNDSFFMAKWFYKKGRCPNVTEEKGKDYLERNKRLILENHNINYCIYLAKLYNNSVDLLLKISDDLKAKIKKEKENIEYLINLNKAEEVSIFEYYNSNKIINNINNNKNNIININNQNDAFSSVNLIDESMVSDFNLLDKKLNITKNYKENNLFIIELDIKKEHPKFSVIVHLIQNFYVFKINVDEEEIVLEKSISEIQLEDLKCKDIKRGEDKNKYYIKFDLKKEDETQQFQF